MRDATIRLFYLHHDLRCDSHFIFIFFTFLLLFSILPLNHFLFLKGMPSDIQAALNGLTVQSLTPNIIDTVNITIYDGEDGNCIPEKLMTKTSYRPTCYMTSVIFKITVTGFKSPEDQTGNYDIGSSSGTSTLAFKQILIGSIVSGVFVIGVLRCIYLRRLKKRIEKYVLFIRILLTFLLLIPFLHLTHYPPSMLF